MGTATMPSCAATFTQLAPVRTGTIKSLPRCENHEEYKHRDEGEGGSELGATGKSGQALTFCTERALPLLHPGKE